MKLLGIPFDKWHAILAVIAVFFTYLILALLIQKSLEPMFGFLGVRFFLFFIAVQVAHHLQCWNEINQALSKSLLKNYGSFENFRANSKEDFKWFGFVFGISWIPIIFLNFILHSIRYPTSW